MSSPYHFVFSISRSFHPVNVVFYYSRYLYIFLLFHPHSALYSETTSPRMNWDDIYNYVKGIVCKRRFSQQDPIADLMSLLISAQAASDNTSDLATTILFGFEI